MLLLVLSIRSNTVDAVPPVKGNGGARRLMTAKAVAAVEAGHDMAGENSGTLPLPATARVSNSEWSFKVLAPNIAVLTLSHALLDGQGREMMKPYRNVEVQLSALPIESGAPVWTAIAWRDSE